MKIIGFVFIDFFFSFATLFHFLLSHQTIPFLLRVAAAVNTDGHRGSSTLLARISHLRSRDAETITVTEEKNALALSLCALGGLNPLTPSSALPHSLDETEGAILDVGAVVLTHDWLDCLGCLVGVVEGDGGDVVVEDVGFDDSVEEVTADEAEFAVDGCGGSTGEGPGVAFVVGEGGVGVLEECDGYEPVVHPEVRDDVPDEEVVEAVLAADKVEDCAGDEETEVAEEDELFVLLLVQRAGGVEMVDTAEVAVLLTGTLALELLVVVVVASDVGGEVH